MPEPLQIAFTLAIMMLGAGGMVTLMMRARHLYGWPSVRNRFMGNSDSDVKLAALKSHEKLALEKLEVLKQALAMGWDDAQLKALDARLDQLVGRDNVARIAASGELPAAGLESMALNPAEELARMRSREQG